jgi:hypothetical protein
LAAAALHVKRLASALRTAVRLSAGSYWSSKLLMTDAVARLSEAVRVHHGFGEPCY